MRMTVKPLKDDSCKPGPECWSAPVNSWISKYLRINNGGRARDQNAQTGIKCYLEGGRHDFRPRTSLAVYVAGRGGLQMDCRPACPVLTEPFWRPEEWYEPGQDKLYILASTAHDGYFEHSVVGTGVGADAASARIYG